MALGWPEKLANRAVVLRPGFVGVQPDRPAPRAGGYAVVDLADRHRAALALPQPDALDTGRHLLWFLATTLVMPWFDYSKTYRPVAQTIAATLPAGHGCLAERQRHPARLARLLHRHRTGRQLAIGPRLQLAAGGRRLTPRTGLAGQKAGPRSGKATGRATARKNSAFFSVDRSRRRCGLAVASSLRLDQEVFPVVLQLVD